MSTEETYQEYYVPHSSKLPIFASLGIFLTVYGLGNMFNEMSAVSYTHLTLPTNREV